jgi:hypothetical protein
MGLFDRYDSDLDRRRQAHSNRNSTASEPERSDTKAAGSVESHIESPTPSLAGPAPRSTATTLTDP